MPTDKEWQDRAKGIIKAELKRRNVEGLRLAEMTYLSEGTDP